MFFNSVLAQSTKPIFIHSAQVNPDNSLTINGDSFGTGTPVVNLDGRILSVSSSSDAEIIAQLPWKLAPGLHMLLVSAGPDSREFAAFNLIVGQDKSASTQNPGPAELRARAVREYGLGHFVEASALLEKALALAVQGNDTYVVALIHDSLGSIYQDEREFTRSEQEFKKAVDILRRQPEHSHALATSLTNFGAALSTELRNREASALITEASRIVKKNAINDPALQVHILNVSASLYLSKGQFKKAEAVFMEALRISSIPQNAAISETLDLLNNLGTLYGFKKDYPKAVGSYMRASEAAEKQFGPDHPNLVTILENLGFAYLSMGQNDEAEAQLTRNLSILERNGLMGTPMAINSLYGLGRISMEKNQLDRAQSLLGRAVETGRAISARTPAMAETLELYGNLLGLLSKNPEAENLHIEAARIRAELALTTRAVR
jgi:tetratricopeptide (TPR) repeat protein